MTICGWPGSVIDALDAPLELQHDGTSGINEFDAAIVGQGVGGGGLAVGAEQDTCAAGQGGQRGVVDGGEALGAQAFAFAAVVDDVAQTAEATARREFLLGLVDGRGDAEAVARTFVNFYQVHSREKG